MAADLGAFAGQTCAPSRRVFQSVTVSLDGTCRGNLRGDPRARCLRQGLRRHSCGRGAAGVRGRSASHAAARQLSRAAAIRDAGARARREPGVFPGRRREQSACVRAARGFLARSPRCAPTKCRYSMRCSTSSSAITPTDFRSGFIAESPAKLRGIRDYFAALCGQGEFPPVRCNAPEFSAVVESTARGPCFFIPGPASRRRRQVWPRARGRAHGRAAPRRSATANGANANAACARCIANRRATPRRDCVSPEGACRRLSSPARLAGDPRAGRAAPGDGQRCWASQSRRRTHRYDSCGSSTCTARRSWCCRRFQSDACCAPARFSPQSSPQLPSRRRWPRCSTWARARACARCSPRGARAIVVAVDINRAAVRCAALNADAQSSRASHRLPAWRPVRTRRRTSVRRRIFQSAFLQARPRTIVTAPGAPSMSPARFAAGLGERLTRARPRLSIAVDVRRCLRAVRRGARTPRVLAMSVFARAALHQRARDHSAKSRAGRRRSRARECAARSCSINPAITHARDTRDFRCRS